MNETLHSGLSRNGSIGKIITHRKWISPTIELWEWQKHFNVRSFEFNSETLEEFIQLLENHENGEIKSYAKGFNGELITIARISVENKTSPDSSIHNLMIAVSDETMEGLKPSVLYIQEGMIKRIIQSLKELE